jgi:hypothetical protein
MNSQKVNTLIHKTHKASNLKKPKKPKTLKLPHFVVNDIPKFFQEKYARHCKNIETNSKPKLITENRTYYPSQSRIIVIGDVHGDLDALINSLLLAKVIKLPGLEESANNGLPDYKERTHKHMYDFFHSIEWIGGDTFVVQLGDQIDRIRPIDWDENDVPIGDTIKDEGSSLHIFFLMWYLNQIAKENGGRVLSVLGNHEIMNIEADFRYVSPFEFEEYYNSFNEFYKKQNTKNKDFTGIGDGKLKIQESEHMPKGYTERYQAFSRGEIISNFFALNYKLVIQVGKWLFMHAGLTDNICGPNSICKINNSISKYLLNYSAKDNLILYKRIISCSGNKSPVWNREFGDLSINEQNRELETKYNELLNKFNTTNEKYHKTYKIPEAKYIAIGHTPQFYSKQNINSVFNGKIWRCDVGMSRAFGPIKEDKYRNPQVLEILDDDIINVITS